MFSLQAIFTALSTLVFATDTFLLQMWNLESDFLIFCCSNMK